MAPAVGVRQGSGVFAGDAPTVPGVYYLLTRTGRLSYVGKAANLRRRLGDHARDARWEGIADVRWEVFSSEEAAIAREADVIVALQPARNRAIRSDEFYSFVTFGRQERLELASKGEYGCFPHLGRGAYSGPGRACIDGFKALGHVIRATRPDRELVHAFLTGDDDALLAVPYDEEQPHVRFGVERDRCSAKGFFQAGPRAMRALRLRHGGTGPVTREQFVEWIRAEVAEVIR
ncbi:MAG TPA: GIY-YIG nuclease family protein [Acidimicrobiales bacterium]|nr:GIY-YIG nuclease family protein [Acidimicrobiales bacterium]